MERPRMRLLTLLLAWKGIEAADELFTVCQSAASDQVFDRALKRYVQLVSNPAFTGENRLLSLRKVMEIARTSEQKALILRQIQRADTFLALMYASEFLEFKRSRLFVLRLLCGLEYRS